MKKKMRVLLALPLLLLLVVLALAAVDLGSDRSLIGTGGTAADSTLSTPERGEAKATTEPDLGGGASTLSTGAAVTRSMSRPVISTGQVTVRAESVNRARAEVMRLVASWGGTVADEQSSSNARGRTVDSTLTLRVPSARFDEAMNAFGRLGKVVEQSRKSEDVTTQVIDNDARVRAAERSIRRIENLLGRADELSDVIAIEADLARRQADLDSLRSQQAYLDDQTTLSTINVFLSRAGQAAPEEADDRGFLAGLESGWTALKAATVLLLTVLGAVLPFAFLLALLGVPLWLVLRRRNGHRPISGGSAPARSS